MFSVFFFLLSEHKAKRGPHKTAKQKRKDMFCFREHNLRKSPPNALKTALATEKVVVILLVLACETKKSRGDCFSLLLVHICGYKVFPLPLESA